MTRLPFPFSESKALKAKLWCKAYNVKSAASQAVATNAAVTSAYALTIETAVAERIDKDTVGRNDTRLLSATSRIFSPSCLSERVLPWSIALWVSLCGTGLCAIWCGDPEDAAIQYCGLCEFSTSAARGKYCSSGSDALLCTRAGSNPKGIFNQVGNAVKLKPDIGFDIIAAVYVPHPHRGTHLLEHGIVLNRLRVLMPTPAAAERGA